MKKLSLDALTVTSFEVTFTEPVAMSGGLEPTHPRCSLGATGCEYCTTATSQ